MEVEMEVLHRKTQESEISITVPVPVGNMYDLNRDAI